MTYPFPFDVHLIKSTGPSSKPPLAQGKHTADMAETRSSHALGQRWQCNPSTLTTAEASISGEDACKSRKRSTMSWERDFVKAHLSFSENCNPF
jgi:hypothetical protein